MKKHTFLWFILAFIGIASSLTLVGCKKESQESSAKPVVTTEGETAEIKTPEALGQEIFEGKGECSNCHKPDVKLIGPSLQDIAKTYKEKGGDIVSFLKEEAKPIVDPAQYEIMKANFAITEEMSDEELKALEAYVYSNLK